VTADRYRLLGLARPRAEWFRDLSRWATSAALPVEFVKCVGPDELLARLGSGRAFSAVVVDGGLAALDRDLVDRAREVGAAVLVVDDGQIRRDWAGLGVDAVLPDGLDRAVLLSALAEVAQPLRSPDLEPGSGLTPAPTGWRGRLVAVTGPAGGGSSTVAMALARGLAEPASHTGTVVLADLALHADQALLHDAGDVVPGVQELTEAHRGGRPTIDEVRRLTFELDGSGHHLLLGLRRHRDWTVLRPRAVEAALDSLQHAFRLVVADVDADVEGDDEVGSVDVEDRNLLARATLRRADLVVVVAPPSMSGLRRLVVTIDDLVRFGIEASRLLPVVTRAPRRPRARAEITAALGSLTTALTARGRARVTDRGAADRGDDPFDRLASPVFVAERRNLDDLIRTGAPLPRSFGQPVIAAVEALLDRQPRVPMADEPVVPVAVVPGSLGSWSEQEAAG
jgi:hypothetical protein